MNFFHIYCCKKMRKKYLFKKIKNKNNTAKSKQIMQKVKNFLDKIQSQ